jgi:PAS domain S-box-containing protein
MIRTRQCFHRNQELDIHAQSRACPGARADIEHLFNLLGDLVCIAGTDGYLQQLNPAWETTLGYSRAELMSAPFIEWIHPDDRPATQAQMDKIARGDRILNFENRYCCRDGSYRWLSWRATVVPESGIIYGVARDITDGKLEEERSRALSSRLLAQQTALMRLAKSPFSHAGNLEAIAWEITETAAEVLTVARASIWFYDESAAYRQIRCYDLYQRDRDSHSYGILLSERDYPAYFKALETDRPIDADRARSDPRTREFTDAYLVPLGITSMLDCPIRCGGKTVGVLCLEHIGEARSWQIDERNFASYLAYTVSLTLEARDRQVAKEAAVRLTRNLQDAQRIAHIGNWEYDIASQQMAWSEELFRIFGLDPDSGEPSLDEFMQQIHPEDRQAVRQALDRAANEGEAFEIDHRLIRADGSLRYLNARGAALRDDRGQLVRLFGTAMDITESKQAQIALEQQLQREQFVNSMLDRVRKSLNLKAVLHTAVEEVRQFLGVDRVVIHRLGANGSGKVMVESIGGLWEPLLGLDLLDCCFDPEQLPILQQGRASAIGNVETADLSDSYRAQLQEFEVKASLVVPILQGNGLWGLLVAHHCQEARPWQSVEIDTLKQLSVQLAIAIQQSILFAQAQAEITERKEAEAALKRSESRERAKADQLQQALLQLRQTQAQLVQTEKMASLGQMVAGVAHEINNPINFIYGNLAPAQEYVDDVLDLIQLYRQSHGDDRSAASEKTEEIELDYIVEDLPKLFASMRSGAERIKDIVRSLRVFSRLDEAELKAIDLNDNLNSALIFLQHRLKATANRPAVEIVKHYGCLPPVECYAAQLNQVVMNLLANALDVLDEYASDPETETRSPRIDLATELDGKRVRIRIGDNGSGIRSDMLSKIFDPFYTTKPVGKGTGLGLSVSYQIIVDRHGGRLDCYSEPGQGTEFVIEIPLKQTGIL